MARAIWAFTAAWDRRVALTQGLVEESTGQSLKPGSAFYAVTLFLLVASPGQRALS
jgi:hypothetical protein